MDNQTAVTGGKNHGLNPFDIRATAWTKLAECFAERGVLIPLISGQLLGHIIERALAILESRLNPFDIRATAWTSTFVLAVQATGLNPFDIRATAWTDDGQLVRTNWGCLNPFDIRATAWTPQ